MNEENLRPMTQRTPEDVKRITTAGGKASGVARREKRKTLDMLELALSGKVKTKSGATLTREQVYILSVIRKGCKSGSVDLLELVAKLRGELVNRQEVEVSGSIPAVLTEEMVIVDTEPLTKQGDLP